MTNTENKFEYDGLIYIAVEESSCRLCDFNDENKCSAQDVAAVPSCFVGAEPITAVFALS